jgi:hypothetical protein
MITVREGGERRERDEASSMATNYGLLADSITPATTQ